jgi:PIN domain nuclease of toxin-antitoxin system
MAIVLDTHVWVWLVQNDPKLSRRMGDAIESAAERGPIHVSAISLWEIALLAAKRRVEMHAPLSRWFAQALSLPSMSLAPVTPEVAIDGSTLPGEFHADPADRIIVATARTLGAALVTIDERIQRYARAGHVRLL